MPVAHACISIVLVPLVVNRYIHTSRGASYILNSWYIGWCCSPVQVSFHVFCHGMVSWSLSWVENKLKGSAQPVASWCSSLCLLVKAAAVYIVDASIGIAAPGTSEPMLIVV